MSCFAPSGRTAAGLDARKRVNYQLGLVLGEDEFRQDQFHHRERDHWATRALHGYGTVSGLGVSVDEASGEVRVAPGLAVDAAGHLLCVPVEYCADLTAWLTSRLDDVLDDVSAVSIPGPLTLYVVLCYTECETDDVPIPSESCLSAEESRAASRILESFELRLVTSPPPSVGEVAPGSMGDLSGVVDELLGLLDVSGASTPDTGASVAELLREWAVERRPEVAAGLACLPAAAGDGGSCVLLARIDLDVAETVSGRTAVGPVVDDADRPILVSTRFLQETILGAAPADHVHRLPELTDVGDAAPAPGDVLTFDGVEWEPASPAHVHTLDDLDDVDSARAGRGDVLTFGRRGWRPAAPAAGTGDHGALAGLGDDDHPQYLLANGTRPLAGDLSADGHRLSNLPASTVAGQPIVHDQAAAGDLTGAYPDPIVAGIRGTPVEPGATPTDTLLFRDDRWLPSVPRLLPFATIDFVEDHVYLVWLNLDAPTNIVEVVELTEAQFDVQRETDAGPSFLRHVGPTAVEKVMRNVYRVEVGEDTSPLRFTFSLERIEVEGVFDPGGAVERTSVAEWATRSGVWFVGQGGIESRFSVTTFVMNTRRIFG